MQSCGCLGVTNQTWGDMQVTKQEITVADRAEFRMLVNNPCDHQLEYRYVADRGQVIANGGIGPTGTYYAPYTGGPDKIQVSVYDRNDGRTIQVITKQVFIIGESVSYVDRPTTGSELNDYENGLIKIASINGLQKKKEIAWGRTPSISPDGRTVAYVSFQGDGTSQIFIKDPVGNEVNLTNSKAFNLDPSWSPIGSDRNQYIVFSSDRISSNTGAVSDGGHGQNYHLWRMNVNGSDLKQITNTAGNDFQPDWSPDGRTIAFSSTLDANKSNPFRNIWVLDLQSGRQAQSTHETIANKGAFAPKWSIDSKQLVYERRYNYRQSNKLADMKKIWMINSAVATEGFGQIATRNFDENILESYPSWHPSGRKLGYIQTRGAEHTFVSVDLANIRPGSTGGAYGNPTIEGDLSNISEVSWSRQRYYGDYYNGGGSSGGGNNPFNPTPSGAPF
ncbi:MAG: hypothetical protein U0457_03430 [Candidatus Sericytochromatia bacterium]